MPTEIEYNHDGSIKTIWLDADAAPLIDVMLDCIEQAEARDAEERAQEEKRARS